MKHKRLTQTSLSFIFVLYLLIGHTELPLDERLVKAQDEVWTSYTNANYVNALAVEGDYVWAATEGGVVRWDSRDSTYLKYTHSDGLADNNVKAVAIDHDESQWFGTFQGGVSHFDGATWTTFTTSNSGLASDSIYAIAIDNNGGKWFGFDYFGVGVSHFDGVNWKNYTSFNSGLASVRVSAIAIDPDGSKWFGTANGVSHFDGATWTTYTVSNSGLVSNEVKAIAIDPDGSKWFGTANGVSHFDGATWTAYTMSNSGLASNTIYAVAIDNAGGKWFGGPSGRLSHFDGTTWTTYTESNSALPSDSIFTIAVDGNGGKWFGFGYQGNGIIKFGSDSWTTLTTTDNLVHNQVQAIDTDETGSKWFGTANGASWLVGSFWNNYTTANSNLKSAHVRAVAIDNDDTVWFGTGNGASHFDGVTWTTYDTFSSGLASNSIYTVAIDHDGGKWFGFGIQGSGVSHFDGNRWKTYTTANSELVSDTIYTIAIDADGSKWFGTAGGVSHFDGTKWTSYNSFNSDLTSNTVYTIAIDTDGGKWFGTSRGVSHLKDNVWTTYTITNSGLVSSSVYAIAIAPDGGKWFGTHSGVSHFNGTAWTSYTTTNSGLVDNWVDVIVIDHNGAKWFGTYSGLSRLGTPLSADTYVRVIDEVGRPIPGAWIYRNGVPIVNVSGVPYSTNSLGILLIAGLDPTDRLVALAPRHIQSTVRAAHGPPSQAWAYRINVTNAHLDKQGHISLSQQVDPDSGEYLLTTAKDNTLVTFNLVISIEWDASDEYISQIKDGVRNASNYLYDLTDGQMAIGQIAIYDNGEYWAEADIQISTTNIVRPHAYVGGIASIDKSHVIRIGRAWNGKTGNEGAWNSSDGYRTLAHEFGHYALHLYDEYFAYTFDQNGHLTGETPATCIGPQNRNSATDVSNASAMDYQYTSSELSARGVPGLWSLLCEQTAQWQLNPTADNYTDSGESAWETIARIYGDTHSPSRWQLITPLQRGGILIGPSALPNKILALPFVAVHNSGISGEPRELTVYGPDDEGYRGAIVALYKQKEGRVVGQGLSNNDGYLEIYGAEAGDIVRAASFDSGLTGNVIVGAEAALRITLKPVDGLTIQAIDKVPHMRVIAQPSHNPDHIVLFVSLQNFSSDADPNLIVTEPGSDIGHTPLLSYSPATGAFEGTFSFNATEQGTGHIRTTGSVGNSLVRLQSTYRLQRVVGSQKAEVFSDDGNLRLFLTAGSISGNQAYFVVMPPGALPEPLPAGLTLIGNAYDVTASGALVKLEKPSVLKLYYDETLVNPSLRFESLAIYRWESNSNIWQMVGSKLDKDQGAISTSITTLGTYALMASFEPEASPLQNTTFLPLIIK